MPVLFPIIIKMSNKNPILDKNPKEWNEKEIDVLLSEDTKLTNQEEGKAVAEVEIEDSKEGSPNTIEKETAKEEEEEEEEKPSEEKTSD